MSKRLILLILSLTLITSCGFKLRGTYEMSSALSQIFVDGGNREIREQLIKRLEQSGSSVVSNGDDAPTLFIIKSDFERILRSTDADGIATGYDYRYELDFSVEDNDGTVLQPPSSIFQQRSLDYDPENNLAAQAEEEFLREEMENEIVLQIMRRLSRI